MPSNSATKQHSKSNSQSKNAHNKTQEVKAKKIYIRNLNENVKDIYNIFGLKATEYRRQTSSAETLSKKAERIHHLYHRNKIPTTFIQMLLNQEGKYRVFLQ